MNTLKKLGVVAAMVTSLHAAGQTQKSQKELHKTLKTKEKKHHAKPKHAEIEARVIGTVPIEVHIPEGEEISFKNKMKTHITIDDTATREHILDQVVAQYAMNYPNKQIIIDIEAIESLDNLIKEKALTKGTMLKFIITPEGVIARFIILMSWGDIDKSQKEISNTLKAEGNQSYVVSIDAGITTPIEELDETEGESAGYPLGTVVVKSVTRDSIMQQLSEKYAELYKTDKVLLDPHAINNLDTLIQSGELKPGMRVRFKTENKAMKSFYIYKEPSRDHIKRFEINNK